MNGKEDKRISELLAHAHIPFVREALERLSNVFHFGAALMAEHGVSSIPELPEGALAEFLEYQEKTFPGFTAKTFGRA